MARNYDAALTYGVTRFQSRSENDSIANSPSPSASAGRRRTADIAAPILTKTAPAVPRRRRRREREPSSDGKFTTRITLPVPSRESCGQLPRSTSIDSVVEAVYARRAEPPPPIVPRADRALSLVSPAVGRRAKGQRGQAADNDRNILAYNTESNTDTAPRDWLSVLFAKINVGDSNQIV
ncbi:hypothetical protein EVAR_11313_1 [Eumeta japonica]|uniref:Uncharacterized protein n=1 Tax=Eumeta variegata TaxID=151549 RepID=A0A4C1U0N7_EUMVA|nr:hypothetical protein EVAR_11313_1 [Eumeta japonica]